ncbi:hypothetical protein LWI28_009295 [Acer negundo]|uniref:Uncharacterized protein n=1 Tax=Acer negundo TaxID=4023 RepID=A0AAD5P2L1_ACENE|nr:hypothetical protein LWI28_009295 [Acer negundo]
MLCAPFTYMTWTCFRFNDFGVDGGHAVKELIPKVAVAKRHISSRFGVEIPDIEVLYLVLTTPLLHDFYNYGPKDTEFVPLLHEFLQCVALFGALLYFIGMKNSILKRQHKKKAPKAKTV